MKLRGIKLRWQYFWTGQDPEDYARRPLYCFPTTLFFKNNLRFGLFRIAFQRAVRHSAFVILPSARLPLPNCLGDILHLGHTALKTSCLFAI